VRASSSRCSRIAGWAVLALVAATTPAGASQAAGPAVVAGTIAGTVTSADGPLTDVDVVVYRFYRGEGWVDVDSAWTWEGGTYEVTGLEPGTYRMSFDPGSAKYAGEYYEDAPSIERAKDVTITSTAGARVDAELGPTGAVSGVVTGPGGTPLQGVRIEAYAYIGYGEYENVGAGAVTEVDGSYRYDELRAGTYRFRFEDPSRRYRREFWDDAPALADATDVRVADGRVVAGVDAELAPPVVLTSSPRVSGAAQVGSRLTATSGAWTPTGATFTYRWLVGGVPVAGASAPTFVVPASALGRAVRVEVRASKAGFSDEQARSAATARVVRGTIRYGSLPRIAGPARVGRRLSVSRGTGLPPRTRTTYQWYAGGRAVPRATRATFRPDRSHRGRRLTVRVTASAPGYTASTVTTRATRRVAPRA
jgi:hypothetical protein